MNQLNRRAKRRGGNSYGTILLIIIVVVAAVLVGVMIFDRSNDKGKQEATDTTPSDNKQVEKTPESDPTPTPIPLPDLTVAAVDGTRPADFSMQTALQVDGESADSYTWDTPFNFGLGDDYTDIQGVISFRGNNFRNGGSYGTIGSINIQRDAEGKPVWGNILEDMWHFSTYSLQKGVSSGYSGSWTGSGWSGQPLLVKWDNDTKQIMNMYDSAKSKDNLVEAIYSTMDGCIYFIDIETGEATRDKLFLNIPFKGVGSLDPRGYPILYLGAGESYDRSSDFRPAKAMAVSLIDYEILYEFGQKPDSFGLRDWTAYDSSALVCAENDCLIYPGENGVLYITKMNTEFNKEAGTIAMHPSTVVKMRYTSDKDRNRGFALGYEGSAAAYSHYIFLTENTGLMHCIDLNTMTVAWAQDIWDDTNASPVFTIEDGECYLYVGNTVDTTADSDAGGETAFFKIKASTGEIVWKQGRRVFSDSHITGGVMSSATIGKGNLEGMAFIVYASYSERQGSSGRMVAINTDNGEILWEEIISTYAWSSPVAVYDEEGNGYLVQCNCGGNVYLVEGKTGDIIDKLHFETNIEATPAVFDDIIVIGTRTNGIHGIRIKTN